MIPNKKQDTEYGQKLSGLHKINIHPCHVIAQHLNKIGLNEQGLLDVVQTPECFWLKYAYSPKSGYGHQVILNNDQLKIIWQNLAI